jgi:riboflavin synthase
MFTGLVEDVGVVAALERGADRIEVAIAPGRLAVGELAIGDSVAIDGVCLTVTARDGARFRALAGAETLAKTTLGGLTIGTRVNLERAARLGDRLGGHLVQGHVDGVAALRGRRDAGANLELEVELPAALARYVVAKGSIAIDGVSLTVNRVGDAGFEVALIPHTVQATALGGKPPGARVNLEVDLIAKYVERLMGGGPAHPAGHPFEEGPGR